MRGGPAAGAVGEEDEHAEDEHIAERDDVEGLRSEAVRGVAAAQRVGGGQRAQNEHRDGQAEAEEAELLVPRDLPSGDEADLHDEQDHP